MADFGAPVAARGTYNPNQALSTLQGLYSVKQAQAVAQQQQQTAKQRAGIAKWMQSYDPGKHTNADGTIDLNAILDDPKLREAAGDSYPEVVKQFLDVKQNQLQAKQSLVNLNDATRKQFEEVMGGLRTDPDVSKGDPVGAQKMEAAISQFAATSPDAARIAQIYSIPLMHTPPDKWVQTLSNMQLQAQSASAQASAQAPQYASTGGQLVNVNPQAPGGNLTNTPNLRVSVPPGAQTFLGADGNTYAFNPQDPGHTILVGHGGALPNVAPPGSQPSQTPVSGASQPAQPVMPAQAPPIMNVGGKENITAQAGADQKVYSADAAAGATAPINKNILHNIQQLAGQTVTGPGSQSLADVETVLGQYVPGLQAAADAATKRQLLGKYVYQLGQNITYANYGNTDTAREMLKHSLPDPSNMTPEAIKQAAKFVMSQQEIAQSLGSFANHYYQNHGGNTTGYQQARTQFMQNIDPRFFDLRQIPDQAGKVAWMHKTFGNDKAAKAAFLQKYQTVLNDGGFDYPEQ